MSKISFISPTQGNPIATKRTIDSLRGLCDEFIIGDVCVFDSDREIIESYKKEYNLKIVRFPFDYIFKNGFAKTLNGLAEHATNNIVLYLNVGEVVAEGKNILEKINSEYNVYYIDHSVEKHRWWRMYNPNELKWDGLIHEELVGEYRPYHKPIFRFADTEKDSVSPFKANVYNDIKEMVYWNQLIRIADNPSVSPTTNEGWVVFAKETYDSMNERIAQKGERYFAFAEGRIGDYLRLCEANKEFKHPLFQTTSAIEFQGEGQKKFLL